MTSIKWFVASICLVVVQAFTVDPGPQIFEHDSESNLNNRGVVMKEVTLYLTPSQIRILEASKEKGQQNQGQADEQEIQKLEAEIKRQLEGQNLYINGQSDIPKPVQDESIRPIVEPSNEGPLENLPQFPQKWTPLPNIQEDSSYFSPIGQINHQYPNNKIPQSYSFIKFYTDEKVHETPKVQLFHPIPHQYQSDDKFSKLFEVQRDPLNSKEYKLIPYQFQPDNSPEAPKPEEIKEITKWLTESEQYKTNANNVKPFVNPQLTPEQKTQEEKKEESQLKYAPNFADAKHAAEYQEFVIRLEKENALAKAEAILKSPPVVVRKEVTTKRRPISGNKYLSGQYFGQEKSPILRRVWKY